MGRQYRIILAAVATTLLLLTDILQSTDDARTGDTEAYPDAINHTIAVASATYKFPMPTDMDIMEQWSRWQSTGAVYIRDQEEIIARSRSIVDDGGCVSAIEVLAWLMDEVNARNGTLILAYGGLIHLYREKDLLDPKTGKYYDDDFDLWSSLDTFAIIGSLEKMFFENFGWSIRFMANGDYIAFIQVFATCGHHYGTRYKSESDGHAGIEIYPLPITPMVARDKGVQSGGEKANCVWNGYQFLASMVYPTKRVDLKSVGSSQTLHLQVPNDPFGVLMCIYGNWEVPSTEHATVETDCTDFYSRYGIEAV